MSTSDPDRPADDATAQTEGSTPEETVPTTPDDGAAAPVATPVAEEPAAAEPVTPKPAAEEPTAAEAVTPGPVAEEPVTEEPAAADPVAKAAAEGPVPEEPAAGEPAATDPVGLDTGRHAVVRPSPVPPADPAPAPVLATAPVPAAPVAVPAAPVAAPTAPPAADPVDPAIATAAAAFVATPPPEPVASYGAITPEPDVDGRLFPDPNAPSSPSVGSRILGIIVGLILAPIGVAVLLLGESQILEAQVDGWDASTSAVGIVLVTLGLLLLGCVLLLGIWTAAVPITGGAVLTAAGAFYLYTPSIAREQTLLILTSSGWHKTVTQVTVSATSGMVLAAGFLLLLAGIVIASARRRGVHLGEFRERHKV
ncbi:hypothetical protein ACPPVS_15570 [Cellulomonas sp. McL0617]|uniref:hypothetical protein n=1 Tax=Cellulomonas sp. McL0617 TaxID=3415675 RepID=UPI003CFA3F88